MLGNVRLGLRFQPVKGGELTTLLYAVLPAS